MITATRAAASSPRFTLLVKTTAMNTMPTMSSMIASARRKIRRRPGSPLPKIAKTPSANAMSVAVGMGQPAAASDPAVIAR